MARFAVLLALALVAIGGAPATAQVPIGTQLLTAPDGQLGDGFGRQVAISGNRLIVGANGDDNRALDAGSAYIFVRDGKGKWTLEQKLAPASLQAGMNFGSSVDIDGDIAVVGAPGTFFTGVPKGAAYVFQRIEGVWTEAASFKPDQAGARYGWRVSASTDTVAVSAPWGTTTSPLTTGAVYVYRLVNGVWTQEAVLNDDLAPTVFGRSIDLAPSVLVVARGFGGDGRPGLVRYVRHASGWSRILHVPTTAPAVDGQGEESHFNRIASVAAAADGSVLLADRAYTPSPPLPQAAPPPVVLLRKVTSQGAVQSLGELASDTELIELDSSDAIWSAGPATLRKRTVGGSDSVVVSGLSRVQAIESDGAGGMFVFDRCALEHVTGAGVVTTVAGAVDDCAYVDGAVASARFQLPKDLVKASNGALFVADGNTLRKVTLTTIETVAGLKYTGSTQVPLDGVGTAARFGDFRDLAIDATDTIWVSDTNRLRKVSPTFLVTTVAGGAPNNLSVDGSGTAATLNPVSLDVAFGGQIVFGDESQEQSLSCFMMRASTFTGDVRTVAGWPPFSSNDGYAVAVRENEALLGNPTIGVRLPPVQHTGRFWRMQWPDDSSERIPASVALPKDVAAYSRYGAALAFVGPGLVAMGAPNGCLYSPGCEVSLTPPSTLLPVVLWRQVGAGWTVHGVLPAPDLKSSSGYGSAMASNGELLVVGAPQNDLGHLSVDTSGNGQVYLYDLATLDTDNDTMPDTWELTFGLNPGDPADAAGDLDTDGVTNAQEYARQTHPAADTTLTRYFAEGATSTFFDTRFHVANPGDADTHVLFTFLKPDGTSVREPLTLPARADRPLQVGAIPGMTKAEFATTVETDHPVVVDRLMSWDAATAYGSHGEHSTLAPAPTWYLAEGATHSGFELFYLILNPSSAAVDVQVTYLRPSGTALQKTYTVGSNSRFNIWVDEELFGGAGAVLANTDVSAVVEALEGADIIVERAMYLTRPGADLSVPGTVFSAGHASAGLTAPAITWFFAEGATGNYFDEFLLLANPAETAADVLVTFLLPDGTTYSKNVQVAGQSRFNIWVDQETFPGITGFPLLNAEGVSATLEVTNGVPIVAERAMWWPGPTFATWAEAHNSAGATTTATTWVVGAGRVADGPAAADTYYLIANPSATDAAVKVTVLYADGAPAQSVEVEVVGQSRFNIDMRTRFPDTVGRDFGVQIESLGTTPVPIVVEWAVYSDALGQRWAAGAGALATVVK